MRDKVVLVVGLEVELRREIARALTNDGAQVVVAVGASEALRHASATNPDLIIIAGGALLKDERALFRQLRNSVAAPMLIIAGAEPSADLEQSLVQGADDFILRPVRMSELFLRGRVLVQRSEAPPPHARPTARYADDRLQLDIDAWRVCVAGKPVRLARKEFDLLAYLYRNAGQVLTVRQILENVWGWECRDNREYVHAYINRLRRKLEPDPSHPIYLITEFGIGYRFERQPVSDALPSGA